LRNHCTGRAPAASNTLAQPFLETDTNYQPPHWASHLAHQPQHRIGLGMLPTPIHAWPLPGVPEGVQTYIKRDDLTGMQLSGNKARAL
jgi:hypothetical protein